MSISLIVLAGIFNLGIAVFHLFFWRLFGWHNDLASLKPVNRVLVPVMNLALTFMFALTGTLMLLASPFRPLLAGMGAFWLFRAALQPLYFGLQHWLSKLLLVIFLAGALLHAVAWQVSSQVGAAEYASQWQFASNNIHFQAAGSGDPLVFIHGAGLDARMWDREFSQFATTHSVIRYDIRGFGLSGSSEESSSHIDDLLQLLDELGHEQASIVGLSMGGGIALEFALAHPERVDALVLAAPSVSGWQRPPETAAGFSAFFSAARSGHYDEATDLWLETPAVSLVDPDPVTLAHVRRMSADNVVNLVNPPPYANNPDATPVLERLESLAVPTLVVVGDRDADDLRELARLIISRAPDAVLLEIADAGHVSNLDSPDAFIQAIARFLNS